MKLKEIIKKEYPNQTRQVEVVYRTYTHGWDIFVGACLVNPETLEIESLDGDNYSLDDEFITYQKYDDFITCYFESEE